MDSDNSKLQALMDEAYSRWQNQPDDKRWSKQQFWDQLSDDERLAVFVGNFNCQVENGGWFQWWDNGYCTNETGAYLVTLCDQMATETALKVGGWLREWASALPDSNQPSRGGIYSDDDEDLDDEREALFDLSNQLSNAFYEVNETWLTEVEAALVDGIAGRLKPPHRMPMQPVPATEGVRYPHIVVQLVGQDSNAFNLIGLVHQAMRRKGVPKEELDAFDTEARSGDYDNVLVTCMKWVTCN